MEDKQLFEALRLFVPQHFNTIDGFIQYFKTQACVNVKRIDLQRMSLEIKRDGVLLIDYEQHKTETYDFTYRALKDFLLKNWPQGSFNLNNQISLFGDISVQLNNSF